MLTVTSAQLLEGFVKVDRGVRVVVKRYGFGNEPDYSDVAEVVERQDSVGKLR